MNHEHVPSSSVVDEKLVAQYSQVAVYITL